MELLRSLSRRARFCLRTAAVFGLALIASAATFKPATLLLDINSVPVPLSSYPVVVCDAPGWTLLLSQAPNQSYKLWRTDGTTAGTLQVAEFATTQSSSTFNCLYAESPSVVYFQATSDSGLARLWRSDGTQAGTFALTPEQPGIYEIRLLGVQGVPLFVAQLESSTGAEIVRTDGTVAGTTLLRDFTPGTDGSAFGLAAVNLDGQLFFDVNGSLWATDGTSVGTRVVIDNPVGQEFLSEPTVARAGNRVLFAYIDLASDTQLWSSDGTTAGSLLLTTFHLDGTTAYVQSLKTASASRAVFSALEPGQEYTTLWRTDGTPAGTQPLRSSQGEPVESGGGFSSNLAGGLVIMAGTATSGIEPWFTDGTDANTRLLHDHGPGSAGEYISDWTRVADGVAYTVGSPAQWWFTNGTPVGTWSLAGLNAQFDADNNGFGLASSGSDFLIWSDDRNNSANQSLDYRRSLWRVNTAARTLTRVVDITPHTLTNVQELRGGRMLVGLNTGFAGSEPWITDGTPTGLRLLRDLEPEVQNGSSEPILAFNIGANALFAANDGTRAGLWTTDGSAAGTQRLSGGAPVAGQNGVPFLEFGGSPLYAGLNTQGMAELWRTDGTVAGTTLVRDLSALDPRTSTTVASNPGSCGAGILGGNGAAYFGASPLRVGKLFRTDGSSAGTVEVAAFPDNSRLFIPSSRVCVLSLYGGYVYFEAIDPQTSEILLWRSNGQVGNYEKVRTAAGTSVRAPLNMMEMGGSLWFFTFAQNQWALWTLSSADPVARPAVTRTWTSDGSFPQITAVLGNTLLFRDSEIGPTGPLVFRMYRTDGTAAGTYPLSTTGGISPLPQQSGIRIGNQYLYPGVGDATGIDLWFTDGTAAGTTALRLPVVGDQSFPYPQFVNFNGLTYIAINRFESGLNSTEIWRTDGTAAGTERVNRVPLYYRYLPGAHMAVTGQRLVFAAITEATGSELWSIENEAPVAQADSASTTSPNAVTVDVLANDSDPDGSLARSSLRVAGAPANGAVSADGVTGTLRYTPNPGFTGTDTFRYIVADKQGRESAPATVSVSVSAAPGGGGAGGGGGGGGGSLDWLVLGALLTLGVRRLHGRRAA